MLRTRFVRFYTLLLVGVVLAFGVPLLACGFGGGDTTAGPTPTSTPSFHVSAADFAGKWVNDDANTRNIPQLSITSSGQTLTVHGYGACSPTYCDWGTISGTFAGEPYVSTFLFDGSRPDACCHGAPTVTLKLSFVGEDTSHLQAVSQDSAAGTITNYMHRGSFVSASDYAGTWNNVDPNTRAWVRVVIALQGNTITAHFYGACSPTPCDAGSASASFNGNPVHVTLNNGFAVRSITLLLSGSTLQVTTATHFTDNSGRGDYTTQDNFQK